MLWILAFAGASQRSSCREQCGTKGVDTSPLWKRMIKASSLGKYEEEWAICLPSTVLSNLKYKKQGT